MENPVIRDKERQEEWQDQENAKIEALLNSLDKEQEDKLQTYHTENCADGVLDDELYDSYQDWLGTLNREEIMQILEK
jgi:hypothetical protein